MPRAGPVSPSDGRPPGTDDDSPTRAGKTRRQTFPRTLRLLSAAEFALVFQNGQRTADSCFTILFHRNARPMPRLGFAISKKQARLAVSRNRLRRLVRESFRTHAAQLPAVDLVVLARAGTQTASNRDIMASLDKHWARLRATAEAAAAAHKGNSNP